MAVNKKRTGKDEQAENKKQIGNKKQPGKGSQETVRKILYNMLLLLYPNRCPVCDRVLTDSLICPQCARRLKYISQPVCYSCGKPLNDAVAEYCLDCTKNRHEYRQGRAVFSYQGPVRGILYRYKYSNRRDYTEFFASEAAGLYGNWVKTLGISMVIPIPLSAERKRQRGYNQADLFARRFAGLCGLPYHSKILIRTRDTVPQKELSARERKNNLKNAFKITENVVNLNRILLIDDIYTTGSTIDAAARVLKQSGVKEIYYLCISIGQGQ